MKQEAQFQSALLRALRSHAALKDAVVLKLNADATTKGIPDVMISLGGVTTFFELKCEPNDITKIQAYYLRKFLPRAYIVGLLRNGEMYVRKMDGKEIEWAYKIEALADAIAIRCVNA